MIISDLLAASTCSHDEKLVLGVGFVEKMHVHFPFDAIVAPIKTQVPGGAGVSQSKKQFRAISIRGVPIKMPKSQSLN